MFQYANLMAFRESVVRSQPRTPTLGFNPGHGDGCWWSPKGNTYIETRWRPQCWSNGSFFKNKESKQVSVTMQLFDLDIPPVGLPSSPFLGIVDPYSSLNHRVTWVTLPLAALDGRDMSPNVSPSKAPVFHSGKLPDVLRRFFFELDVLFIFMRNAWWSMWV